MLLKEIELCKLCCTENVGFSLEFIFKGRKLFFITEEEGSFFFVPYEPKSQRSL